MPGITKGSGKTRLTIRLSDELLQTVHEAISLGLASSTTSFVEDAVRSRSREVRHARMRLLAAEAVADPGFLEDMRATSLAFNPVQADSWPSEPQTPLKEELSKTPPSPAS